MKKLLTQKATTLGEPLKGIGKLGLEGEDAANAPILFNNIISMAIGIITIVAFIWFLFKLITGAIAIMSAGSDKQALENAKSSITMGIIGLIITVSAIFLADLIGNILGIENLLNPASLLDTVLKF
ncbi:hypothetical protein KJ570_01035 [Patescibacteria group bacterium]|nr:hypothetical protein [Patescibacteria group bacterium]MBU2036549.1 hypothetical protein [Patescibacteria group bacterium]